MSRKTQGDRRQTEGGERKALEPENPDDELKFLVYKANLASVKKSRVLCVRTRSLLGYNTKGGKTSVLDLADISGVEKGSDKKRVTLTFTNSPKMVVIFPDSGLREKFLGRLIKLWRIATEEKSRIPYAMFDHTQVKVCSMTWNVGGSSPPDDSILELVLGEPGFHDLYIFNFQEASKKKEDWCMAMKAYCESGGINFAVVSTTKLWDMVQMILSKESLRKFITQIESDNVACGVGDVLGNKGGMATSFNVFDTSMCAVNCHLAARSERLQQRRANYIRIIQSLQLGLKGCDIINQFDHVIWAGDLNYRVEGEFYQAVADVKAGKFERLGLADQLISEMQALRVLAGFKEGPLDFAPTYRWDRRTPEVSNKREQIPSWTDRVLWKSVYSKDLELKTYKGFPEAYGSDHRPVIATFLLRPRLPYDGMEIVSSSSTVRDRRHVELGITFPRITLDIDVGADIIATLSSNVLESSLTTPAFARTEEAIWEGSPIKFLPFVYDKEELKGAFVTITFSTATEDTGSETEKGLLGYALIPLSRIFGDAGFNVMITKGGQVIGQFSGKLTNSQKGAVEFELEVPPAPVVKVEKSGGLFSMFSKTPKQDATDGDESNRDTIASELAYVSFPFKSILDKWLFQVEEYLTPSKDNGPAAGLHGALSFLKALFLLGGRSWAKKFPTEVGLIKSTRDCGNASVGMGLAYTFMKQKKDSQVMGLVDCGPEGTRLQLYVKTGSVVSLMQEFKAPGTSKGVFSNLRVGMYLPQKENSADQIKEEIRVLLQSAPWANQKVREKLARQFKIRIEKLVIPVFGFVRGTIRDYWETCLSENLHESDLCGALVNQMMDTILGAGTNLTPILNEPSGYFLKQQIEGQMELIGTRVLYSQYSTVTNRKLEVLMTLAVGRNSTRWTTVDLENPNDHRKSTSRICPVGMDTPRFPEKLASWVPSLYSSTEELAALIQSAIDRGHTPVIALKSGCLLNVSDGRCRGGGGKKRRKMLTEVVHAYYYNMMPVKATLMRWTGESVEHEISSSSVAAICAEAETLLAYPDEDPKPQFVKVNLEGKDTFLTDLVDLPQGSVLVFATAHQLIGNPFLLLSEPASRFPKDERKKPPTARPQLTQLNTDISQTCTPNSSAPNTPTGATSVSTSIQTFFQPQGPMNSSAPPSPLASPSGFFLSSAPASPATTTRKISIRPEEVIAMRSATSLLLAQAILEEDDSGHAQESSSTTAAVATSPEISPEAARLANYQALFASPDFNPTRTYVEVLFDDDGSPEDGELALTEFEIIELKRKDAEWWFGSKLVTKEEGLFPHNFVKVLDLDEIKLMLSQTATTSQTDSSQNTSAQQNTSSDTSKSQNTLSVITPPPPPPQSQITPAEPTLSQRTPSQPPTPSSSSQRLSCDSLSANRQAPPPPPAASESVSPPSVSTPNSRLSKEISSAAGPSSLPSSPVTTPSSTTRSVSVSSKNMESDKKLAIGECFIKAVAVHSCDATNKTTGGTYLSFNKGDQLVILKQKSERWWWAVNSKGIKGWVPANHVQIE